MKTILLFILIAFAFGLSAQHTIQVGQSSQVILQNNNGLQRCENVTLFPPTHSAYIQVAGAFQDARISVSSQSAFVWHIAAYNGMQDSILRQGLMQGPAGNNFASFHAPNGLVVWLFSQTPDTANISVSIEQPINSYFPTLCQLQTSVSDPQQTPERYYRFDGLECFTPLASGLYRTTHNRTIQVK
jgi:hypothetical protein